MWDSNVEYHPKQKRRKAIPRSVATACRSTGLARLGLRQRRNQKAATRANSWQARKFTCIGSEEGVWGSQKGKDESIVAPNTSRVAPHLQWLTVKVYYNIHPKIRLHNI